MSSESSTICVTFSGWGKLNTFGDRLLEAYETTEIAELARKLGVTYQAAKNYVAGRLPSPEKLVEISRSTACSIDWLLTGEGAKWRSTVKVFDLEKSIENHHDWVDVVKEWYELEGQEMPDTMGASFMGGWKSFDKKQKIDAITDFKRFLDRIKDD